MLLEPASRDGHTALQQLLAEMFGAEADRAEAVQHGGDLRASSASSCSSASYLRPVSTADGAAPPCADETEGEVVSAPPNLSHYLRLALFTASISRY